MPAWMEKWGVGLGLMGEQGAESIHTTFNTIERSYMPNKVDRLLRIMQEHHLRIDPDNLSMVPAPKKRKTMSTCQNEE